MRSKILLIFICVFLIGFSVFLSKQLVQSKLNAKRLENSFATSQKSVEYYKGLNGKLSAKIDVMELKHSEIKKIFPQILSEIENLKIKSRHVKQYSETVIHQDKEIITEIKDSIVYDTISFKSFDYSDEYFKVFGNILNDSVYLKINTTDSIIQVIYKGKRPKPWLWFFSPRQLQQSIQSKNPYSRILYSKTIQISK